MGFGPVILRMARADAGLLGRQDQSSKNGPCCAGSAVGGAEDPACRCKRIALESRTVVRMAVQRSRRGRVTGGLCGDAPYEGGAEGTQDGPQ
jgi:hypothetical protein